MFENFACISTLSYIVFKIYCLNFLVCISALVYCSDANIPYILDTICKGKMALGTSVKAAIGNHSAKVGLGSPAISKMELFVTLYDCYKEPHLRCCRGPWSTREYKFSFCIDHHNNFPCLQKKLCYSFFLLFVEVCPSVIYIFFWKVDRNF